MILDWGFWIVAWPGDSCGNNHTAFPVPPGAGPRLALKQQNERPTSVFNVLDANALAGADLTPCNVDSIQKRVILLQPVIEPVLFTLETDQYSGRFAMSSDHDFFGLGLSNVRGITSSP